MDNLTFALLLGRDWLPISPWWFGGNLLFAIISWLVGNAKGNGCVGFILGLLIGPIGLIITFFLPSKR